ncbi:MAG: TonB-dependent receptor, partial [Kangiellaceae bacterium]|nr:TonB-dependent receptor [Kangiellaceae bacterium]
MKKFKFSRAALLIAGALTYPTISSAAEDDASAEEEEENKVVITGSRIKRSQAAGALPVTIITKAQLQADGITSAEQLMLQLNITANSTDNLASNNGITSADNRGNNGFSGANLRQQGADSTLVLLNGRRVATHGMKGRAVDINSIPFAAIDRIEILRDGASAVYGTDAIGGVINFIMKQDYEGLEVSAFTDVTEAGGGNINRFSIVGGVGDMVSDGYNLVATLSYKDNKILRGTDRDFTNTFQPDRGLSPDTRGPQFASLNDRWRSPNDPTSNHYNLIGSGIIDPNTGQEAAVVNILDLPGGLGCDAFPNQGPYDHQLWNSASSEFACAWDYPRASVLRQPVETTNFVIRGTTKITEETELFAEVVASQVVADKVFEPIQVTPWSLVGSDGSGNQHWLQAGAGGYQLVVDALSDFFGADHLNLGAPIAYRWRCIPCGPRQIETQTDALRILVGWQGTMGDWDWETGFSYATSEGKSDLKGGYYYEDALAPILGSGAIDPFLLPGQSHSQAGLDALAAASAAGTTLFSGKSTLKHVDFSISGDTGWELSGGNIMVAAGFDYRVESFGFNGDRRQNTRRIDAAPFDESNILSNVSRDVAAVYGEALLPVTDNLELTFALRHDNYDGFGGTTNPKVSLKFNPADEILFRASYSTGFRVPSFNQLFSGVREEDFTGQDMVDPLTCSTGVVDEADPNCQRINPNIIQGGKDDLDPEESVQASAGVVFAPLENLNVSIDWWSIKKEGT